VLKVMDFGIAKVLEQGASLTATHIGSPAYAAPEQQAGSMFRKVAASHGVTIVQGVSPATDVWALGLVCYELITGLANGQYWAAAEAPNELLMKITMGDTELPSVRAGDRAGLLPPGFDAWFDRCLRKNAAERFQSASEAVKALLQSIPELPYEPLPHDQRSSADLLRAPGEDTARAAPNAAALIVNTFEMDTTRQSRAAAAAPQGAPALGGASGAGPMPSVAETSSDWTRTSKVVDRSKFLVVAGAAAALTILVTSVLLGLLLGKRETAPPPPIAVAPIPARAPSGQAAIAAEPPAADTPPEVDQKAVDQEAAPKPPPEGKAILRVRSKPWVCRVSLDDAPKGPTPVDIEVRPGVYVVACKTLAESQQRAVVVKLGASEQVEFDWSP
jgi:hypothetical protein